MMNRLDRKSLLAAGAAAVATGLSTGIPSAASNADVVIIGAGAAGLAAAQSLAARKVS